MADGLKARARRPAADALHSSQRAHPMTDLDFDPGRETVGVLAAIVAASDDAIIGKSLDGLVLAWNAGAERMYGYRAEEVIGQPITRIVPDDRLDEWARIMARVSAGERVDTFDTARICKDGRRIDVSLTVSPIRNRRGRVVGASAIGRDVTAEHLSARALRHSEARWRAVIETAPDGIIMIDAQGAIELFNPAAERLFGREASSVIGANVSLLMPESYARRHDGYLSQYARGGEPRIIGIGREVEGQRADGTVFPVHLSIAEVVLDGERKFVGMLRDLTERRRLEERLRGEAGLVRLGELAAVLAHEVRNPLAAVSGAIQMLREQLPNADDRDVIDEIVRRLDSLGLLMNDLLLYARPPRPHLVRFDLGDLLDDVGGLLSVDPAWRHVVIARPSSASIEVSADPELLKMAIQNLMLNAMQAIDGRGTVRLDVEHRDGFALIDVTDAGPGIAPDILARLFTPFFTTKARGTGLGLATSRRIAESLGGGVEVLTTSEAGTTMRLTVKALSTE
jgi:two-component system sensor kinase FixL